MDRRWAYKEYMPAGSMLLFRRYISRLRLVRPRIFMGRRLAGFAARAPPFACRLTLSRLYSKDSNRGGLARDAVARSV